MIIPLIWLGMTPAGENAKCAPTIWARPNLAPCALPAGRSIYRWALPKYTHAMSFPRVPGLPVPS
jgi:hypothetical protein